MEVIGKYLNIKNKLNFAETPGKKTRLELIKTQFLNPKDANLRSKERNCKFKKEIFGSKKTRVWVKKEVILKSKKQGFWVHGVVQLWRFHLPEVLEIEPC